MATRTKGGVLLPVIAIVAVVAVFGANKVIDTVTDLFTGGGTATLGEGDSQLMVSDDAEPDARRCTVMQLVNDKRCGSFRVVVFDAERMPFITRNISENSCQGGTVSSQYPLDGDRFLVVITHPGSIASDPFAGVDIAKDQTCGM
jgi:hypothetical protein